MSALTLPEFTGALGGLASPGEARWPFPHPHTLVNKVGGARVSAPGVQEGETRRG